MPEKEGCLRFGALTIAPGRFELGDQLTEGKLMTKTAPPSGALKAVMLPSRLSTISLTTARPMPAPPQ